MVGRNISAFLGPSTGEIGQWEKALLAGLKTSSVILNPHGIRREPTPAACLWTLMGMPCHVQEHMCARIYK